MAERPDTCKTPVQSLVCLACSYAHLALPSSLEGWRGGLGDRVCFRPGCRSLFCNRYYFRPAVAWLLHPSCSGRLRHLVGTISRDLSDVGLYTSLREASCGVNEDAVGLWFHVHHVDPQKTQD